MSINPKKWRWHGRLLCRLGMHDCDVIEVSFRFADGDCMEKLRCKRCGIIIVSNAQQLHRHGHNLSIQILTRIKAAFRKRS